jgi:acyl-coenzyme A thioesterase PaaI-like protein
MAATPEQLEAFASITWAAPYLASPRWEVRDRSRGSNLTVDTYCRETLRANNGVLHWVEMFLRPTPSEAITKTISLFKFGNGLTGFAGICHGGAILSLMDESLSYAMFANESMDTGSAWFDQRRDVWTAIEQGKPMAEVLKGMYVTAKLDIKFLQPVVAPGLVGIETQVLESKGYKMTMRGTMKDAKGTLLMQADGVWVKIGGTAKL